MLYHLFAKEEPPLFFCGKALVGLHLLNFSDARLNGEVCLALRNNLLGRIGILNYEVTGVSRELYGDRRTVASLADLDHIVEVNDMIFHRLTAVAAGCFCLVNDIQEITIISIFKGT